MLEVSGLDYMVRAKQPTPDSPVPDGPLHNFFARRKQAAASEGSMPHGAEAVHEAIDNKKELEPKGLASPRRNAQTCLPGHYRCGMCALAKKEDSGFFTGRNKNIFYCHACNNIEKKIRRLAGGTPAMQLWKDLSTDDKQAFRAEKSELESAALKDNLSVKLVQKHLESNTESSGHNGEYLPLSVYKSRGYDDKWLKFIEDTMPSRGEGALKTFALRVHFEKSEKEIKDMTESIWKPLPEPSSGSSKRARSSSSCSSSSSSTPSSSVASGKMGRQSKSKKAKREAKTAAKAAKKAKQLAKANEKDKKLAKKLVDKIAPILKMLEIAIEHQLSPSIEKSMPEYQVKDAKHWLQTLKDADNSWTKVMKQECTINELGVDEDETWNSISCAKVSQQTFSSSMTLALANIKKSEQTVNNKDNTKAKTTKKQNKR